MVSKAIWDRYCELCCIEEPTEKEQEQHQGIESDISCDTCGLPMVTEEQAHELEEKLSAVNTRPAYVDRCTCSKHDSPCGRMHVIANLYNDPAGLDDTLVGLQDLKLWPMWWFTPPNDGLDDCFALVFHEPGVTREEAEAYVRVVYERGELRPEWYEHKTEEEFDAYYNKK